MMKNKNTATVDKAESSPTRGDGAVLKESTAQGLLGKLSGKNREKRFLILLPPGTGTTHQLEAIWLARRFQKGNGNSRIIAIAPTEFHPFLKGTGLVDECHDYATTGELPVKRIKKSRAHALYFPYVETGLDWKLRRISRGLLLGSGRSGWYSRLIGIHSLEGPSLKGRGAELFPGADWMDPIDYRPQVSPGAHETGRVWIDLRGSQGLIWPAGHIARLVRLFDGIGLEPVVFFFGDTGYTEDDRTYLQKQLPGTTFQDPSSVEDPLALLAQSSLVIGPHGPGIWQAGLLGRPVIALHTRHTRKASRRSRTIQDASDLEHESEIPVGEPVFPAYAPGKSVVRHLVPDRLEECATGCENCSDGDCIHRISPERVFDEARRILGR